MTATILLMILSGIPGLQAQMIMEPELYQPVRQKKAEKIEKERSRVANDFWLAVEKQPVQQLRADIQGQADDPEKYLIRVVPQGGELIRKDAYVELRIFLKDGNLLEETVPWREDGWDFSQSNWLLAGDGDPNQMQMSIPNSLSQKAEKVLVTAGFRIYPARGSEERLQLHAHTILLNEAQKAPDRKAPSSETMRSSMQIVPNPNTGTFRLQMELGTADQGELSIRNMQGVEVRNLRQGAFEAGHIQLEVDDLALPAGIYLISFHGQSHSDSTKLVIQ